MGIGPASGGLAQASFQQGHLPSPLTSAVVGAGRSWGMTWDLACVQGDGILVTPLLWIGPLAGACPLLVFSEPNILSLSLWDSWACGMEPRCMF